MIVAGVDGVVAERFEESCEADAEFHSGEGSADGVVDAVPERDRSRIRPIELEFVGIGEPSRVAVGGAEENSDSRAFLDGLASDRDLSSGDAHVGRH